MKIRKFTFEGHEKWKSFYTDVFLNIKEKSKGRNLSPQNIKDGYNNELKKRYQFILGSQKEFSEELENSKDYKIQNYDNSYQLAQSILYSLSEYKFEDIDDEKMWDWLALVNFEKIFVPGKIRGCASYRYCVEMDEYFSSFRHLIRGPCWAVNQYKSNAKIFTCTKTYEQNDWLEQYIKISFMREMKVMAEVCMRLYYDYLRDESIPGTSKGTKPGIFPRLRDKMSQYSKVKFLWEMNADEIIKMLPKEFNKYRENLTYRK
jgi:hypothetical protein